MDCRRVEKIFVESGRTDAVNGHLAQCPRCKEALGAYDALVSSLAKESPLDPVMEDRILGRVLAAEVEPVEPPARRLPLWPFGAAVAAAAVLSLFVLRPPAPAPRIPRVLERTGALAVGDVDLSDEVIVPVKSRMTVDFDRGLVVAFGPNTRATAPRLESGMLLLPLSTGVVHVRYDRAPSDPPLTVKTPAGRVTVVGTVFSVAQQADRFSVRVDEGVVEVETAGRTRRLAAGEVIGDLEPAPPLPGSGARLGRLMLFGAAEEVRVDGRRVELPAALALQPGRVTIEIGDRTRDVRIEAGKTVRLALSKVAPAPEPVPESEPAPKAAPRPAPKATPPAPVDLETLYERAEAALAARETTRAVRLLRRISRRDPNGPTGALAEFEIGRIHAGRMRHRAAKVAWNRALKRGLTEPLASEARLGVCAAELALGRVKEARACVEKLEGAPAVAFRAAVVEGQLSCLEGRFDRAEQALAKVKARPKSDLAARLVIARIRCDLARGDREGAARKLAKLEADFGGTSWERQIRSLRAALDPKKSRK